MQTNESERSRKSHHQSASARRAEQTAKAEAKRQAAEDKRAARAKAKAAKAAVTAAINRLDAIGKEITAKLVLHDKASVKADDMLISVNELLKEAEKLCADNAACGSMMSFATFKEKVCPSLGRSAAYEVRAILLGKKTKEELALSNRTRQAKHQAKVRAERFVREAEKPASPLHNGRPDPQVGMPPGPKRTLLPNNTTVVVNSAGNDGDPVAESEVMKAKLEALDTPPKSEPSDTAKAPATAEAPAPEPKHELTPEQKSDNALAAFKAACDTQCPWMTKADLKQARIYLMEQRWKPRGSMKAA